MSGGNNSDGELDDVEFYKLARNEAQRTIDHQIETINDIDEKAARILRLNLILLSILFTGLSLLFSETVDSDLIDRDLLESLANPYVWLGLYSIIISTVFALFTYTGSSLRAGMSGRDLRYLIDNEYSNTENLHGIIEGYSRWAQHNYRVNTINAPLGTATLLFLLYGILSITAGITYTLQPAFGQFVLGILLTVVMIITWRSGIVGQLRRYLRYRNFEPDKS